MPDETIPTPENDASTAPSERIDEQMKALEDAERAIDYAYNTGRAQRSKITQTAQLDAAEAVAMAGIAMEADEEANDKLYPVQLIMTKSQMNKVMSVVKKPRS